jgi:hypothetical protein
MFCSTEEWSGSHIIAFLREQFLNQATARARREPSDPTERELSGAKKRVLSAAGRAAIVKAAKKRWAKIRKQARKAVG